MSVQAALDQLATYRAQNTRSSQDVFEKGALILEKNAVHKMGDDSASSATLTNNGAHIYAYDQVGRFWNSWRLLR